MNVAVIDSGIDVDHPDLNVAGGVECSGGKGFDDRHGHGTMVAGLIAARDNAIGRVGVASGAPLWAVRVGTSSGDGITLATIICGVDWVTSTRLDSDAGNDIPVANISLGLSKGSDKNCASTDRKAALRLAICRSIAVGRDLCGICGQRQCRLRHARAGDLRRCAGRHGDGRGDGQPGGLGGQLPEGCPPEEDDTAASFNNFATLASDQAHTLAAPGVCLGTTLPDGQYGAATGTSFSAPLVAGTVVLCLTNQCGGLNPQQIVQKIVADARAYNEANPGYGLQGDPLRPLGGRYYGYLIRAGSY